MIKTLFPLGQALVTPGACRLLADAEVNVIAILARHATGDWGDICEEDKELNNEAVKNGDRILSAYKVKDDQKVFVITEANRVVTTILLPSEY